MGRIVNEPHEIALLKLLYNRVRASRTELAAIAGYSNFLVSRVCGRLLSAGYISDVGSARSTGGRRATLLSITPGLGRLVGLHAGTVNARAVVTDIAGNVLAFLEAPSLVQSGPLVALPHLCGLIREALRQAAVDPGDLLGIGIGISGLLDRATGTTLSWPKVPAWKNVPVRDEISHSFPVPVKMEDTPRTMALAERRFGCARNASEFLYLMIGAGVGAALFLRGQLYTGSSGFAGEFGHIAVERNGPLCDCGGRGCLEAYVSALALIRKAADAVSGGLRSELWHACEGDPKRLSVELIARAAEAGDRFSLRLIEETASLLGEAVAGVVNLLNPELVVLGGGVAAALGGRIFPTVDRIAREYALKDSAGNLKLELSRLGGADWALGASLLVGETALERLCASAVDPARTPRPRRYHGAV